MEARRVNMNDPVEVVARTIFGEARSEGMEGMAAVANVIGNRVKADINHDSKPDWWGEGYVAVCLKPWQFSCWNENDPNRALLINVDESNARFKDAMVLAAAQVNGQLRDRTGGADSYYAPHSVAMPKWAATKVPTAEIGAHRFFKTI